MNRGLSFKIENTKVDSKAKIETKYQESISRKDFLINCYATALFYNPEIIQDITTHIAAEIGYQKAIKDLADNILMLA